MSSVHSQPTRPAGAVRHALSRMLPGGQSRERRVQLVLGLLWLVDGALQLQPVMFTRQFATGVLLPVAGGNPHLLAAPIRDSAHLVADHAVLLNVLFAMIQLGLGVALLVGRGVRTTLFASLLWSGAVWWLGEGFGGLLGGGASPVSGAPGAVALYGLAALLAWPTSTSGTEARAHVGLLPAGVARLAVAALWLLGSALLLQPANLAPRALASEITGATGGEPRALTAVVDSVARAIGSHGLVVTLVLASVMALIAVGLATGRATRATFVAAVVLALALWLVGQDLGGILAGGATDPNTGPLLALNTLALAGAPALAGRTGRAHSRPAVAGA